MPRRAAVATATSLLLILGLSAGAVSAGGGTLVIGDGPGGADAEDHDSFSTLLNWDGSAWPEPAGSDFAPAICGDVEWTGGGLNGDPELGGEIRMVLEFPLAGLPAGATITGATLSLRNVAFGAGDEFLARGFAGNGTPEGADAAAAGTPLVFAPTTTADYEDWDVTTLMTPAMVPAGWAGFVLAPDFDRSDLDAPSNFHRFRCFDVGAFPILTIEYDLPPPAASSLPNAATAPPTSVQPIGLLGVGLFLASMLGTVAVVSARRSR
jgi:hypothetical protein